MKCNCNTATPRYRWSQTMTYEQNMTWLNQCAHDCGRWRSNMELIKYAFIRLLEQGRIAEDDEIAQHFINKRLTK